MTKDVVMERYQCAQPKMRRVALHLLQNAWDAEDVLQNVFLKAWLNAEKLHSEQACDAWLMTICKNACMDVKRKQIRLRETNLVELVDPQNPEDWLKRFWLEKLLEGLRGECAQAVEKYYFWGYPIEDIADMMNKPAGTVKGLLYQARKGLRKAMEEYNNKRWF